MTRMRLDKNRPPHLRVLALGPLTYQDYRLGNAAPGSLDEAFQRQTYHIDYCKSFRNNTVPLLTLVAKGCTCTEHTTKDIGILRPYCVGLYSR